MVTETTATADIERLERRTFFRDRHEVVPYLMEHPSVVAFLHETLDRMPSSFGPDAPLVLEMRYDPEDEAAPGDLFASIQTPLEPEQAMPMFDRFADEWWREAAGSVDCFAFSLDYV